MYTPCVVFLIFTRASARISIAEGKYHAVRHIDCAFGANIDLHKYPLIHRRRDDGPPSPQRLLRNRGKVGVGVVSRRDDGPPLLGGAAPFSSRQRRATFLDNGKVTPQNLLIFGRRGKVGCVVSHRGATIYMLLYKVRQSQAGKSRCVIYIFDF